ncbi:MAG: C13 family peptidase, partial [Candidatus Thorarchaeota archaeon]
TIALVVILVVSNAATLFYFMYLDGSVPASDVPMGIADVFGSSEDYIGKTVTLIGYLVMASGNYIIVSNPMFYFNNSLSVDNYVVLSGPYPDVFAESIGKQIAVTGLLEVDDPDDGTMGMMIESFFDITYEVPVRGAYVDERYTPYPEFDLIPELFDPTIDKYAVLYSGGIKPGKDHYRYWNDIIYMYFILQMHGYEAQNIYVIYKDGVGEDTYTPVDYPATHASLDTVFTALSTEMGRSDTLFFYTTNHGGGGGISVWNPMDPGGALTHTEVSDWLDMIDCRNMIIVMEQCVSGKFISHISAQNRVVMTACKDDESSFACDDEGNWDEFVYHFMCALVSFPWNSDGSTVDADFNNNGYISMREAFIWAAAMDSRSETPWYNDNGDGVGYNVLQVAFGSGPWQGDNVYLNDPPIP